MPKIVAQRSCLSIVLTALFFCAASFGYAEKTAYRGMTVSPQISYSDLRALRSLRANLIRLPIGSAGEEMDSMNAVQYDEWLNEALFKVDEVLSNCAALGIKAVLNLNPPGGFSSHESPAQQRIFSESWAQEAFVAAWGKVAARFANNAAVYGYDLLNEPAQREVAADLKDWNALAADLVAAIRAADPKTTIFIEPLYGNPDLLSKLSLPSASNIKVSVHLYYTLNFVQQGLYSHKKKISYPKGSLNKAALKRHLSRVSKYQKQHSVKVYVGEFSVVRWAPGNSAYNYLRDAISIFESNAWDWTYHSWREDDTWSVEHGANAKDHRRTKKATNRKALMVKYFAKNRLERFAKEMS